MAKRMGPWWGNIIGIVIFVAGLIRGIFSIYYYDRGLARFKRNKYEKALVAFNKSIKLYPHVYVYMARGNTYSWMGENEKALADYNKVIEFDPEYAAVYVARGNVYHKLGEREKALASYNWAIELDPELVEAYYNRGLEYKDVGQVEKAIVDFEQVLELTDIPQLRQAAEQELRKLRGE
jgi:tetratricopeptide (TPR) repeat protein